MIFTHFTLQRFSTSVRLWGHLSTIRLLVIPCIGLDLVLHICLVGLDLDTCSDSVWHTNVESFFIFCFPVNTLKGFGENWEAFWTVHDSIKRNKSLSSIQRKESTYFALFGNFCHWFNIVVDLLVASWTSFCILLSSVLRKPVWPIVVLFLIIS